MDPNSFITYVSAPQANIFIDGILIDECYDIQYQYRESKEPIYGYLDQHFNAIVKGTVLITGMFTINYKHDQYLTKALQKAKDVLVDEDGVIITKNKRPSAFKGLKDEYSRVLIEYSDALKTRDVSAKELIQKKAELEKMSGEFYQEEKRISGESDLDYATFMNKNAAGYPELKKLLDDIEIIESSIKDNSLEAIRARLLDIKDSIGNLTVRDVELSKEMIKANNQEHLHSKRAEDFRNGFRLEFSYNGNTHKRLTHCELLGHGHVITQSGMPVKETYTFIARKLE